MTGPRPSAGLDLRRGHVLKNYPLRPILIAPRGPLRSKTRNDHAHLTEKLATLPGDIQEMTVTLRNESQQGPETADRPAREAVIAALSILIAVSRLL